MKAEDTVMSINAWLDRNGIDRAYKKAIKPTYDKLRGDFEAQAEITFKAKDKEINTTIKAVLGLTPEHCNQHDKFVDECMACHDVCNENIDFDLLDKLKEIKQAGIQEVVELLHTDIRREFHKDGEIVVFRLYGEDWQAKLKEWGVV